METKRSIGALKRPLAAAGRVIPARRAPTVVSLTFDDGWASQYDSARHVLAEHGMQATFFVNSNLVGTPEHLTWSQLETLAREGHEVGGHTLDHPDLTAVDRDEARRQIFEDRTALIARGFDARSFAYPGGAFDASIAELVCECGYDSARAAFGLRNLEQSADDRRRLTESVPPRDLYAILTPCCLWSTTTLETLVAYVERAERNGGWIPLVLHRVCDDCGGESPAPSISPSTFALFLQWLSPRASAGTVVRTVADVIAADDHHAMPSGRA